MSEPVKMKKYYHDPKSTLVVQKPTKKINQPYIPFCIQTTSVISYIRTRLHYWCSPLTVVKWIRAYNTLRAIGRGDHLCPTSPRSQQ